jgi:hypothetical protein
MTERRDPEAMAMEHAWEYFAKLDYPAQQRVITWLTQRTRANRIDELEQLKKDSRSSMGRIDFHIKELDEVLAQCLSQLPPAEAELFHKITGNRFLPEARQVAALERLEATP